MNRPRPQYSGLARLFKMKILLYLAILNIAIFMITGCGRGSVLQFKDAKITVQEKAVNDTLHLQITGMVFASALAVSQIDVKPNGDEMIVRVYIVHAREGLSGAIDSDMEIGPKINRVCFGDEKYIIWSRKR
jgi:hypothetical protein